MEAPDPSAPLEEQQQQQQWSLGWLSPRISFSRDLATITMPDRASPEKRKREQHELDCSSDSEFEFSLSNPTLAMAEDDGSMLSADELFVDGKLRPLHLPPPPHQELPAENRIEERCWSMARHLSFENSRCESLSIEHSRGRAPRDCISLGSSRCSSPSRSFSLPATTLASAKASSAKHSSSRFKDFFKLRKLHVPLAKDVPVDLGEEHAVSSSSSSSSTSRRLPISSKSFWPFSRSNSAGESKTSIPPPLPRRSNSAGESKTSSTSLSPHSKSNGAAEAKASGSTSSVTNSLLVFTDQRKRRSSSLASSDGKKNSLACSAASLVALPCRSSDAVALSSETTVPCPYITAPPMPSSILSTVLASHSEIAPLQKDGALLAQAGVPEDSANSTLTKAKESDLASDLNNAERDAKRCLDSSAAGLSTARVRAYGGSGIVQRNGLSSPVRNFARRSPGRRGVWNSPGRGSAGRIVLKNLERCTAGPKPVGRSQDLSNREGRKGSSERPNSYPVSVRVTPVLNVPVYIGPLRGGNASKTKLFNFRSLFSRKEKPLNAAPMPTRSSTNWRNGG